jgi:hypothetical protein
VANVLRTIVHVNVPQNEEQANQLIDNALATAMHATQCAVHRTLQISPGALVYHRDMFLDLPILADLLTIQQRRQVLIDENLRCENNRRRTFEYRVGQQVLIKAVDPRKMEPRAHGPYPIVTVFANGTLAVQREPHVSERINIRPLSPYRQ